MFIFLWLFSIRPDDDDDEATFLTKSLQGLILNNFIEWDDGEAWKYN